MTADTTVGRPVPNVGPSFNWDHGENPTPIPNPKPNPNP